MRKWENIKIQIFYLELNGAWDKNRLRVSSKANPFSHQHKAPNILLQNVHFWRDDLVGSLHLYKN